MIQRIQTVYLAISALLSGLLLNGNIARMIADDGRLYELTFRGIIDAGSVPPVLTEKSLPLSILLIVLPVLFFVAIFLFKNRKLQIRITVLSTLLFAGALLLMLYYVFYAGKSLGANLVFSIKIIFPVIGLITGYLAFRSILRDELLVKSYDRIR